MNKKIKTIFFILTLIFSVFITGCFGKGLPNGNGGDNNGLIDDKDNKPQTITIVFQMKTEDENFILRYNSSYENVKVEVEIGRTVGEDFLDKEQVFVSDNKYVVTGFYYYDKQNKKTVIDGDTVISNSALNIEENDTELTVFADIKKVWY